MEKFFQRLPPGSVLPRSGISEPSEGISSMPLLLPIPFLRSWCWMPWEGSCRKKGRRRFPFAQLFSRPYETILKPYEILAQVRFPKLPSSAKSSFIRLARREAMAIARMSVAVIVQLEKGRIEDIRISVGSVTPTPQRMSEAEAVLKGKSPDEEGLQLAARQVSETMIRQSGIRPSTSYKKPVVEALLIRAMKKALEG